MISPASRKHHARHSRHRRIRAKVKGTASRPRLAIFRSAKHISVQLIDDQHSLTLVSASDQDKAMKGTKSERAAVVFDRGGYLYHGRVKILADAAREAGLTF